MAEVKICDEILAGAVRGWLELDGLSDTDVTVADGDGGGERCIVISAAGGSVPLALPPDFGELSRAVRSLANVSDNVEPESDGAVSARITADPFSRTVSCMGQSVTLSPREYELYEYLARHTNTVISRREMCENVWHGDVTEETNAVDVYIAYLRRKLEAIIGRGRIVSVRGEGYMFID